MVDKNNIWEDFRMKRALRVLLLTAILLISMAGSCFAGSWRTAGLHNPGAGTYNGTYSYVYSDTFTTTTKPYIDFWVHPSSGTKTVYVDLYEYRNGQWQIIEEKIHIVGHNKYLHFIDYSNASNSTNPRAYIIDIDGNYSEIDGFVKYYY